MIKFKAYCTNGGIEKKEVVKETKNFICLVADKEWFPGGRKEAKESDYHKYFDTFNDAKEWVIKKLDERIEKLRNDVARVELYKIKASERTDQDLDK